MTKKEKPAETKEVNKERRKVVEVLKEVKEVLNNQNTDDKSR